MTQEPVVRHYRGAARSDAESAYRNEAVQAAGAGYLPVTHQWTTDWQGFLLVVTYRLSVVAGQPARSAPTSPVTQPEPPIALPPPPAQRDVTPGPVVDEFAPPQRPAAYESNEGFAPRDEVAAGPTSQPTLAQTVDQFAPAAQPLESMAAQGEDEWLAPADEATAQATYQAPESALSTEHGPDRPPEAVTYEPEAVAYEPERVDESRSWQEPAHAEEQPTSELPTYQQPTYQPAAAEQPEAILGADPGWGAPDAAQSHEAAQHETDHATEPVSAPEWHEPVAQDEPAQPETVFHDESAWGEPAAQEQELAQLEPVFQSEAAWEAPVAQAGVSAVMPEPYDEPRHSDEATSQLGTTIQAEAAATQAEATATQAEARAPEILAFAQARQARLTVQTMDLHSAGEPLRIIRSGFPEVPNLPVLERRHWVMQNADHIRRAIIQEPRGHRDMYGAILLPPHSDSADMTVLFMHNEGYSTMCGHGIIAITTGLIEEGLFPATEPVTTIRYEVPAGVVAANAATVQLENGDWAVQGVRFTNVPSYLAAQSLSVRPDGVELHGSAAQYGALSVDLAFGGAYYGIVNAAEIGLRVVPEQADALRHAGAAITDMLRRDHTPSHPTDPGLGFVYGTIIVDLDPRSSPDGRAINAHMRNATIFADAELDRSPCGSGTSAILAQLHARGRIKVGQEIMNAGITGEQFLGRIEAETALGPYPAVSTSIAGNAYVTGFSTFLVDNRDPLGEGFLLR